MSSIRITILRNSFHWLGAISLLIALSGCLSSRKVVYFQGAGKDSSLTHINQQFEPIIQKGDQLFIGVSSLSQEGSSFFNQQDIGPATQAAASSTIGYLVDKNGEVELPLIGKIRVAGFTTLQFRDSLKNKLSLYLKEPVVNVRILNYKIYVLGEVGRVGPINVTDEKLTLPQAISLAGDITFNGRRNNVLVIREENGRRSFARVNLLSKELFNSPYYYLRSNDVIYVQPTKGRVITSDKAFIIVPFVVSVLTILYVLLPKR